MDPLAYSSLVLASSGALFIVVLVVRRMVLARRERRRIEIEERLRPVALSLIAGDIVDLPRLSRVERRVFVGLLVRLSRSVEGGAAARIADFFADSGYEADALGDLGSRHGWKRATAAFLLGDMRSEAAVPALLEALGDRDRDVRAAAARSLGRLRAVEAVGPLVHAFVDRTVPWIVSGQALVEIGPPAVPVLRGLLGHEDVHVRARAVELIGLVGSAADGGFVASALEDTSAEVRAAAAGALGRLGAEAAAVDLRTALGDRIPFVREAAAEALGRLRDAEALDALARLAAADVFEPARAAARAIAEISPSRLAREAALPGASPHVLEAADLAAL